ncbi:MAG TPA: DUF523 and DUF1722 domain-containing protein [Streptosporangiaceae bacterium]
MAGERPRVGVSSCLLGSPVRFNGGHKRFRFLTDELDPYVDWVPYCPEVEIGLGIPRKPIRLTVDSRLVNRSGTADHTSAMAALPLPVGVDGYVFKAKSPSCGIHAIPRYRDDGEAATRGRNANALLHAYSRIGRALASLRRSDLVGRIDAYRRGEVPLSVRPSCWPTTPAAATCRGSRSRRFWRHYRPQACWPADADECMPATIEAWNR